MRLSRLFGQRLRESASDADSVSHDLLQRAGYIRRHASGIYTFLHPGLRALRAIENIVRDEMDRAGAQEILMPFVHSADVWRISGRYDSIDATLARFDDRRGHAMVLGMTHEEVVAQLAASELRSWRQAGIIVYQIQTKFRDEARPRAGLLRTREFLMKDAYSLDLDQAGLDTSYALMRDTYARVFARVGLAGVHCVRSATGDMGGSVAHEFMALLDVGEDTVAFCRNCGAACNVELLDQVDRCGQCHATVEHRRAVEVGNIFQLGTRYSEAFGAYITTQNGERRPLVMGSYGIGVSRLLAALVEQHHDNRGIVLPPAIAPFDLHVLAIDAENCGAHEVAALFEAAGFRVILEDRAVRTGEKFADADLIGAPLRITLGSRAAEGHVEVHERASGHTFEVPRASLVPACASVLGRLNEPADA
jgi:prolyl-tRNA synthetase